MCANIISKMKLQDNFVGGSKTLVCNMQNFLESHVVPKESARHSIMRGKIGNNPKSSVKIVV